MTLDLQWACGRCRRSAAWPGFSPGVLALGFGFVDNVGVYWLFIVFDFLVNSG